MKVFSGFRNAAEPMPVLTGSGSTYLDYIDSIAAQISEHPAGKDIGFSFNQKVYKLKGAMSAVDAALSINEQMTAQFVQSTQAEEKDSALRTLETTKYVPYKLNDDLYRLAARAYFRHGDKMPEPYKKALEQRMKEHLSGFPNPEDTHKLAVTHMLASQYDFFVRRGYEPDPDINNTLGVKKVSPLAVAPLVAPEPPRQ